MITIMLLITTHLTNGHSGKYNNFMRFMKKVLLRAVNNNDFPWTESIYEEIQVLRMKKITQLLEIYLKADKI